MTSTIGTKMDLRAHDGPVDSGAGPLCGPGPEGNHRGRRGRSSLTSAAWSWNGLSKEVVSSPAWEV